MTAPTTTAPTAITVTGIRFEYSEEPAALPTLRPRVSWRMESHAEGIYQSAYRIQLARVPVGLRAGTAARTPTAASAELQGFFADGSALFIDTGWVASGQSQFVSWPGEDLAPATAYALRISVCDNYGAESAWSVPARLETARVGLPWTAPFVAAPPALTPPGESAPVMLRRSFHLDRVPAAARVYATAHGIYELWLNGRRLGNELFAPGWTAYQHRLLYQTYDVSALLQPGENVIGGLVGYGWYAGDLTSFGARNIYGDRPALSLELAGTWEGAAETAASGPSGATAWHRLADTASGEWRASTGPITYAEIYHGESYDARREMPGWCLPGFSDGDWARVELVEGWSSAESPTSEPSAGSGTARIEPQDGPPVRRQETLKPQRIFTTPAGEEVIDFGRNITGWVRFRPAGREGERVRLSHAEVLDADGNFYRENLRSARAQVEYILGPADAAEPDAADSAHSAVVATRCFEPHFTFHGFRYLRLDELPAAMREELEGTEPVGTAPVGTEPPSPPGTAPPGTALAERFEAVVIHSDMPRTLEFSCSDPRLNQLHDNILWGWKGNALDIPSDCPQRDERLGWTGDAQVFVGTATYLTQAGGFFTKWLRDLKLEQREDGGVPFVIPNILSFVHNAEGSLADWHSSTGWGDAAVICPWTIAARYGDHAVLEEQWPTIMGWISYMRDHAEDEVLWNSGFHFGDWVALDAKEGSFFGATPNDLTATAYYAHSVDLAAQIAERLQKDDEATSLRRLHTRIVDAFRREFYTARGRLAARTQTAHLLALAFDLVPPEHRARTVADLITTIRENDDHLVTGFLGTPLLLPVLADNGHLDEAYRLLLREEYPSWLYQVKQGATTVWEHWDGMKPDGSMWSPDMNSFNHYAYGAVGEWMYRTIGGLDLNASDIAAGRFVLAPRPPGLSRSVETGNGGRHAAFRGPTSAELTYYSGYGPLRVAWRLLERSGSATEERPGDAATSGTRSLHLEVSVPPNSTVELRSPTAGPGEGSVTELRPGRHRSQFEI